MTAYALRLENATDTAARVRIGDLLGLAPAAALTARTGIRPAPTAGDVAVDDGTMQVTVEPFVAWVQGGISTAQGGYPFVLDAQATLVLSNGDATQDRIDTIAAVIHDDPYDGSGLIDAAVVVVEGTPGSGAPALPDNCLPLRDIDVPAGLSAGTGGLASGNLSTDRRTYTAGLGGVVPVSSSTERDALPAQDGLLAYLADVDELQVRKGGAWVTLQTDDAAPLGCIGYAQVSGNQAVAATSTDLTGLSVTVTVGTSRRIRISAHARFNAAGTGSVSVVIAEGVTSLGDAETAYPSTSFQQTLDCALVLTPTAGSHTYKLQGSAPGGGNLIAASTRPSFILVEDIGPA